MPGTIKIKLIRSPICTPEKHKRVVKGAGSAEDEPDRGAAGHAGFRGMVKKIPHLLAVVE